MGRGVRVQHLVPAAAVLIVLLVVAAPGESTDLGAVAAPGGADAVAGPAVRWAALGLLAAPAVMVYLHRAAAAWASAVCALGWLLLHPGYGWREILPCGLALVAVLVARTSTPSMHAASSGSAFSGWLDTSRAFLVEEVRLAQPPTPAAMPSIGGPAAGLTAATFAGAIVCLVLSSGAGQPAWIAPALIAAGAGVAMTARIANRRKALLLLFSAEQPVHEARVVDQLGYLHVLVPAPDGRTALEFGLDTADTWSTWDGEPGDPQTRPATLYGEPRPGSWCAVEVDGRVHVPVEPVGATTLVPYDPEHGLPREVYDDEEQLVDTDALLGRDHLTPPDEVHEHRVSPVRAWLTVAMIGLGAALAATEGMHLIGHTGDGPAVAVVAAVAAAAFEFGWRSQVRQRLRWHAGGVAASGFRGTVREPWTVDSAAVHDDEGSVTLTVGDSVVTIPAPPPWPANSGQRTCEQLVAALRDARLLAFAGGHLPPPPPTYVPRRPLLLVAGWAVTVAGAVALFAT